MKSKHQNKRTETDVYDYSSKNSRKAVLKMRVLSKNIPLLRRVFEYFDMFPAQHNPVNEVRGAWQLFSILQPQQVFFSDFGTDPDGFWGVLEIIAVVLVPNKGDLSEHFEKTFRYVGHIVGGNYKNRLTQVEVDFSTTDSKTTGSLNYSTTSRNIGKMVIAKPLRTNPLTTLRLNDTIKATEELHELLTHLSPELFDRANSPVADIFSIPWRNSVGGPRLGDMLIRTVKELKKNIRHAEQQPPARRSNQPKEKRSQQRSL